MNIRIAFILPLLIASKSLADPYLFPEPIKTDLKCATYDGDYKTIIEPPAGDEGCGKATQYIIDLNDDGVCEKAIEWSTGARCFPVTTIYTDPKDDSKSIDVSNDFDSIRFASKRNGYYRLFDPVYDQGMSIKYFDGQNYVCEFCESNSAGNYRDLGLLNYKSNNYKVAEIYFKNAYITSGEYFITFLNDVALAKIKLNEHKEAIDLIESFINELLNGKKTFASSMGLVSNDNRALSAAFFNLSLAYSKQNNQNKAKIYRDISDKFKNNKTNPLELLNTTFPNGSL